MKVSLVQGYSVQKKTCSALIEEGFLNVNNGCWKNEKNSTFFFSTENVKMTVISEFCFKI